ncbi:uncharacterized protein ACR2FA_003004 [Aphomia sociella]
MESPSVKSEIKELSLPSQVETNTKLLTESFNKAHEIVPVKKESMPYIKPLAMSQSPTRSLPTSPQPVSPGKTSLKNNSNARDSIRSYNVNKSSPKSMSPKSDIITNVVTNLEPQGKIISDHVDELTESLKALSKSIDLPHSPLLGTNVDKIAAMGKILTQEANALRKSIKSLSEDIARTKQDLYIEKEDVNFPYHLFLIEIIINKIHMKCECFELDYNNLVIGASFLGKQPIILYDASYGKIEKFNKINAGKSTLFAMTYDKICSIKEFEIILQLTKEPPCSNCVTKIAETRMDFTNEFNTLREELCKKWTEEQPKDNILCTTSTPMSKNMYYLSCGNEENVESIGVIEVTVRMSFLGKEITTALCASSKPHGTSFLLKEDNGISMYSCHKVEMDDQGKVLLDEDVLTRKTRTHSRSESPMSYLSSMSSKQYMNPVCVYSKNPEGAPKKYDEIFTKINANELKIRVPKSNRIERVGKYDKIQELCTCESTPYNTGEQIQFELPRDLCNRDKTHNTYSSNLKYSYKGCDNNCSSKDNKIINVTPTNCVVPVDMEKIIHPQKDVFILKIGKKLETKDKKTDLEIELVTPKGPTEKAIENNHTNVVSQQCSATKVDTKKAKVKKPKGKNKQKVKTKSKKNKK